MLELKNVTAGYGRTDILKNVSIRFDEGKLTSIIGPNGSGKSTLLRAVMGIIPCKSGEVLIDGNSTLQYKSNDLARRIAYLSQERSTPSLTVAELVLHGRFPHLSYPRIYTECDRKIARAAMERIGILNLADTPLVNLSGGMRQSAYIAMILAQGADHILLDEPLTFLDVAHQISLMKHLRSLASEGRTVVAVMHDLPLAASFSDTIAVINDGKPLTVAPPSELCKSPIIEDIFCAKLVQNGESYSYKF